MRKTGEKKKDIDAGSTSLTIGGVTYKTAGNILFSDSEESTYIIAESPILDSMDKAIEDGILGNGMRSLLNKIKGAAVK
jgi:hypothetical protein